MTWHEVAQVTDVSPGEPVPVVVEENEIALYKVNGEIYATDNICTHAYSCLHEGYLEDFTIECALHQGVFDIRTGEPLSGPVVKALRTFRTAVEDGAVYVEIPETD